MRRILLTGKTGQAGRELQQVLSRLGDVVAVDRYDLDLSCPERIRQVVRAIQPNLIVNAAAYTAVDQAETNLAQAYAVNAIAPEVLAETAQQLGAALIHLSTDYVFDGQKATPYTETDEPNPLGIYGLSKLAGEQAVQALCDRHLIVRTAWMYGVHGKGNFVKTMLRLGSERDEIRVVNDQVGTPTWSRDLAAAIAQFIPLIDVTQPYPPVGIYHFTNRGEISWYDFAIAIFKEAKALGFPLRIQRVTPITTADYPTPARRPSYSVLSLQKISATLNISPVEWRQSLRQMLIELHSQIYESSYSLRR
jgi:dTDP-4-dehydrorhamnose reductase